MVRQSFTFQSVPSLPIFPGPPPTTTWPLCSLDTQWGSLWPSSSQHMRGSKTGRILQDSESSPYPVCPQTPLSLTSPCWGAGRARSPAAVTEATPCQPCGSQLLSSGRRPPRNYCGFVLAVPRGPPHFYPGHPFCVGLGPLLLD